MKLGKFLKASADTTLYFIDYSQWLGVNERVTTVQFIVETVTSPALTITAPTIVNTTGPSGQLPQTMVSFLAGAGLSGNTYTVTVTIVTSLGQTKEDFLFFQVKDPP